MARILTGIQSTGTPHLGNILGAILPAIRMAGDPDNDAFLFIADMHALTQIKDGRLQRENTCAIAAAWLAFGLDIDKTLARAKLLSEAGVDAINLAENPAASHF